MDNPFDLAWQFSHWAGQASSELDKLKWYLEEYPDVETLFDEVELKTVRISKDVAKLKPVFGRKEVHFQYDLFYDTLNDLREVTKQFSAMRTRADKEEAGDSIFPYSRALSLRAMRLVDEKLTNVENMLQVVQVIVMLVQYIHKLARDLTNSMQDLAESLRKMCDELDDLDNSNRDVNRMAIEYVTSNDELTRADRNNESTNTRRPAEPSTSGSRWTGESSRPRWNGNEQPRRFEWYEEQESTRSDSLSEEEPRSHSDEQRWDADPEFPNMTDTDSEFEFDVNEEELNFEAMNPEPSTSQRAGAFWKSTKYPTTSNGYGGVPYGKSEKYPVTTYDHEAGPSWKSEKSATTSNGRRASLSFKPAAAKYPITSNDRGAGLSWKPPVIRHPATSNGHGAGPSRKSPVVKHPIASNGHAAIPSWKPPSLDGISEREIRADFCFVKGAMLYEGKETAQDFESAYRFMRAALEAGNESSTYFLGKMHFDGTGAKQCYRTAFNFYMRGAKSGNPRCMNGAAQCFKFGHGVKTNREMSQKLFQLSAEQKCKEGLFNVGFHMLYFGEYSDSNVRQALRYLRQAKALGDADAKWVLAGCYLRGVECDRDPKYAYELFHEAHKKGSKFGTFGLARCYEYGHGVRVNLSYAVELYREVVEANTWESAFVKPYYGRCLLLGRGTPKNRCTGMRLIKEACTPDNANGWAVLGDCYRFGYAVDETAGRLFHADLYDAVDYYHQALNAANGVLGITQAHFALGQIYEKGISEVPEARKAVHHYMEAARRFHPEAQWRVALAFETGQGALKNDAIAFQWLKRAASAGHRLALRRMANNYVSGEGVPKDVGRAMRMLEAAKADGDRVARKAYFKLKLKDFFGRT